MSAEWSDFWGALAHFITFGRTRLNFCEDLLLGLMQVTKAALPYVQRGHIVNIASIAGRVANPNASGYAAGKFGVVAFSESLRCEVCA
jgi:short-subunit dehydrogenase